MFTNVFAIIRSINFRGRGGNKTNYESMWLKITKPLFHWPGWFCPQHRCIWQCLGIFFGCHTETALLLAASESSLGTLLNTHRTASTTENYPSRNVNSAETGKPHFTRLHRLKKTWRDVSLIQGHSPTEPPLSGRHSFPVAKEGEDGEFCTNPWILLLGSDACHLSPCLTDQSKSYPNFSGAGNTILCWPWDVKHQINQREALLTYDKMLRYLSLWLVFVYTLNSCLKVNPWSLNMNCQVVFLKVCTGYPPYPPNYQPRV